MTSTAIGTGIETSTTRMWPIAWSQPIGLEGAFLGMELFLTVVGRAAFPASVGLIVRGGGAMPVSAWLTAHIVTGGAELADLVGRAAMATMPWLGLGDPCRGADLPEDPTAGITFSFVPGTPAGTATTRRSALWRLLEASPSPWQLTIDAGEPGSDEAAGLTALGVSLVGSGPELMVAASLLEADLPPGSPEYVLHPRYLTSEELTETAEAAAIGLVPSAGFVPTSVAAGLMALIGRIDGAWPVVPRPPSNDTDLLDMVASAVPPHALVTGGSGLGKTTLLEHLVRRDIADGNTVVVICPHGDLARRTAAHLEDLRAPSRMVDLGSGDVVTWNLCQPDPGVDPEVHASLLVAMLQRLWEGVSADFLGPVWMRSVRALLSILVRDPAGPWPLTRFPELLEHPSRFRNEAVARIGDPALAMIVKTEFEPMLAQKDPGNTMVWITSKLDPLIGDPTVRRIIDHRIGTFPVDGILEGESLIVALPEGRLTSSASALLSGLLIGRVWTQAKRTTGGSQVRLYVDEWQRAPVAAIGELLTEGRKFGIAVRLANQNSAQVPHRLWETAMANSGVVVTFRTGPSDAHRTAAAFATIGTSDLTTLPNHWVACAAGGRDQILQSLPPPPRTGGDALAAGHARSVQAARSGLLGAIGSAVHRLLRGSTVKRTIDELADHFGDWDVG